MKKYSFKYSQLTYYARMFYLKFKNRTSKAIKKVISIKNRFTTKKYSFWKSERNRKVCRMVHKVKKFHLNHKNIIYLAVSILFAYIFLSSESFSSFVSTLGKFGYPSAFILGFLFSFGFTTAPAAATLYLLAQYINPFFMATIAALGAMISNFLIYLFIRYRVMEEIRHIFTNELRLDFYRFEIALTKKKLKSKSFKFVIPAISGILTAMPLPTEMFVSILWNIDKLETRKVLLLSYSFSFIGILFLGLLQNV